MKLWTKARNVVWREKDPSMHSLDFDARNRKTTQKIRTNNPQHPWQALRIEEWYSSNSKSYCTSKYTNLLKRCYTLKYAELLGTSSERSKRSEIRILANSWFRGLPHELWWRHRWRQKPIERWWEAECCDRWQHGESYSRWSILR